MRRPKRHMRALAPVAGAVAFFLFAFAAASWLAIDAPLEKAEIYPEGIVLRDCEGTVMRATLGPGDVDCRPRRSAMRDEWIAKAIVASEDKRFWKHCGADFGALIRAVWQNATSGRRISGASTITEQVVRLVEPHPRRMRWKWVELVQALKTERARPKEWILAQYLDRAPFGANYTGIEAASRGWFDKSPESLSLGEAALLAGIVQAPTRFRPDIHMDRAVRRRDYVLARMEALGLATPAQVAAARASVPVLKRGRRPFTAPHYCDWALRTLIGPQVHDIRLPLRPVAQDIAENAVSRHATENGIDCSAVVIDVDSGDVIAMVSSGDYFKDPAGQVNGCLSVRPAGSTLKPFFFLRALERGLVAPTEALPDTPTTFGNFLPANFGGGNRGRVRADEALVLSLNMPFYEIVRRLGLRDAVSTLERFGIDLGSGAEEKYGLGMAVGNVELSLLSLAKAYALLARSASTNAAAWIVSDILSGEERSLSALGHVADTIVPRAAWKTGTSAAFRDAWTVLWTPKKVVAVRCGHRAWRFGDERVTGAAVAAPLAWNIFRALHPSGVSPWFPPGAPGLVRREVCAESGLPAAPDCTETRHAWALSGVTSAKPCPGGVAHNFHSYFSGSASSGTLSILRPASGSTLRFQTPPPWTVSIEYTALGCGETLWWSLDGIPYGSQPAGRPFSVVVASPGRHVATCVCASGAFASVVFSILPP